MSNKDASTSVFDTNETVTVVKIRNAMFSSILSSFSLSNKERKGRKNKRKKLTDCFIRSVIELGGISVPLASPSKPWSSNILKGKRRMWYFGRFSNLYVFLLFSSFPSFFVACGRGGIYTRQNKKKRMQRDTMKESTT